MMTKIRGPRPRPPSLSYYARLLGPSDWSGDRCPAHLGSAPALRQRQGQGLGEQGRAAESDPKKRVPMYHEIIKLLLDEGP